MILGMFGFFLIASSIGVCIYASRLPSHLEDTFRPLLLWAALLFFACGGWCFYKGFDRAFEQMQLQQEAQRPTGPQ
jgi:hypothetical protein